MVVRGSKLSRAMASFMIQFGGEGGEGRWGLLSDVVRGWEGEGRGEKRRVATCGELTGWLAGWAVEKWTACLSGCLVTYGECDEANSPKPWGNYQHAILLYRISLG